MRSLLAFVLSLTLALSGSWGTAVSALTTEAASCCCEAMQKATTPSVSCAERGCACEAHAPATVPSDNRFTNEAPAEAHATNAGSPTPYAVPKPRRAAKLTPELPRPPPAIGHGEVYKRVCAYLI